MLCQGQNARKQTWDFNVYISLYFGENVKFFSLSKFQLYNTLLSTVVPALHIISSDLRFPLRAHAWAAGPSLVRACMGGSQTTLLSHRCFSPSLPLLSPSLNNSRSMSLGDNKKMKII